LCSTPQTPGSDLPPVLAIQPCSLHTLQHAVCSRNKVTVQSLPAARAQLPELQHQAVSAVGAVCLPRPAQHSPAPPRARKMSYNLIKCATCVLAPASSPHVGTPWPETLAAAVLLLSPHHATAATSPGEPRKSSMRWRRARTQQQQRQHGSMRSGS
jgi:hypothetical protein